MHRRKTSKDAETTVEQPSPSTVIQGSSAKRSPVIITPPDHSPASVSSEHFGRLNGVTSNHHRHESTPLPSNKAALLGSPMPDRTPPRTPHLRTNGLASPLMGRSPSLGGGSPRASNFPGASRMRVSATYPDLPLSASPYRSGFNLNGIPESSVAGAPNGTATNGYHARNLRHSRSQSGMITTSNLSSSPWQSYELSPTMSNYSPLSQPRSPRNSVPSSPLFPVNEDCSPNGFPGTSTNLSTPPDSSHRHSRIHSRNLSIFFPRPGDGSPNNEDTIAEDDDGQEIEYDDERQNGNDIPDILIPTSSGSSDANSRGAMSKGFSFGTKDPNGMAPVSPRLINSNKPKRRGHHHKHSLSHNFFSFMDPTSSIIPQNYNSPQQSASGLYVSTPNLSPVQNGDVRILPTPSTTHFPASKTQHHFVDPTPGSSVSTITAKTTTKGTVTAGVLGRAKLFAAIQFVLGAWLWAEGQRQGTLACTGLGYWIVFDAAGVWLQAWGRELRRRPRSTRQPYGSRRVETVALFAQSIYLIFASVYVCKEAFERVLLSSTDGVPGSGDSHEHHHQRIDSTADLDGLQHNMADIAVACAETILTFMIGYPAAVALGKVLLQTAPERGLPGGQMEAFLRVMRELENHPQITHIPAPHLWQLSPLPPNTSRHHPSGSTPYHEDDLTVSEEGTLVATVQLHVKREMDGGDVLELTSVVREQCTRALGVSVASVTVSAVRA
ncbi:hypothetical protein FRB97_007704 [Tulasnella sp. 331]|nr:hypothetical protein FRB97_007704 [Tulasnella sp. 331]